MPNRRITIRLVSANDVPETKHDLPDSFRFHYLRPGVPDYTGGRGYSGQFTRPTVERFVRDFGRHPRDLLAAGAVVLCDEHASGGPTKGVVRSLRAVDGPDVYPAPKPRLRPGEARCLVCNCTDSHACGAGCGWAAVDRGERIGVCDACEPDAGRAAALVAAAGGTTA